MTQSIILWSNICHSSTRRVLGWSTSRMPVRYAPDVMVNQNKITAVGRPLTAVVWKACLFIFTQHTIILMTYWWCQHHVRAHSCWETSFKTDECKTFSSSLFNVTSRKNSVYFLKNCWTVLRIKFFSTRTRLTQLLITFQGSFFTFHRIYLL